MAMFEKDTGVTYDELLGGTEIPVLTANVEVQKGSVIKRGQLVSLSSGVAIPTAKGDKATYIAMTDINATSLTTAASIGTVYTSGRFNREKLIVEDGDTVAAHEEELRDVGIHVTALM